MESQTHCAYNQTRECFLGLEVKAADLPAARVGELMASRPLKSGEGMWMVPFRGIPATGDGRAAGLDLSGRGLPGDRRGRVVSDFSGEFVEPAAGKRAGAAGALDLFVADPARRSACAVHGGGDGAAIGAVDGLRVPRSARPQTIAGAVLLREKPLWSGGPGLLELENRAGTRNQAAQQTHEMDLTHAGQENRRGNRANGGALVVARSAKGAAEPAPGLAAYYWNGAAPAGARNSRYQLVRALCGDRGTLVSGNAGFDDAAADRLRRGSCGAYDCRAIAGGALGSRRRRAAVCSSRRNGTEPREGHDSRRRRQEGIRSLPDAIEEGQMSGATGRQKDAFGRRRGRIGN